MPFHVGLYYLNIFLLIVFLGLINAFIYSYALERIKTFHIPILIEIRNLHRNSHLNLFMSTI